MGKNPKILLEKWVSLQNLKQSHKIKRMMKEIIRIPKSMIENVINKMKASSEIS